MAELGFTPALNTMTLSMGFLSRLGAWMWRPRVLGFILVFVGAALCIGGTLITPDFVSSLLGGGNFTDSRIATVLGGSKYDASFSLQVVRDTVQDIRLVALMLGIVSSLSSFALLVAPDRVADGWWRLVDRLRVAPRADHLVPAAAFVVTLVAASAATVNGLGIDPDSTVYISTARSLFLGEGFAGLVRWPPGYPLLIAGAMNAGLPAEEAARLVTVLALALSVLPLYVLGGLLGGRVSAWLCCFIPLLLWPVALVSAYAWSEMPYIFFSLCATLFLTMYSLGRYGRQQVGLLAAAAIASGCALAVRYIGVSVIAAGCLVLLMHARFDLRKRFKYAAGFGLAAALPMCVWILRNLHTTGTLAGERSASAGGLLHYAGATLQQVVRDMTSGDAIGTLLHGGQFIVAGGVGFLIIAMVVVALKGDDNLALVRPYLARALPTALYVIVYLATLIAISSLWEFLPIYIRFTAPIYPFIMLLIVSFGVAMMAGLRVTSYHRAMTVTFTVLVVALTALQLPCTLLVHNGARQGYSYNSPFWREAPSIAWAQTNLPDDAVVYSNDVYALRLRLLTCDLEWLPRDNEDFASQLPVLRGLAEKPEVFFLVFKEHAALSKLQQSHRDMVEMNAMYDLLVQRGDFPEATIWQSKGHRSS